METRDLLNIIKFLPICDDAQSIIECTKLKAERYSALNSIENLYNLTSTLLYTLNDGEMAKTLLSSIHDESGAKFFFKSISTLMYSLRSIMRYSIKSVDSFMQHISQKVPQETKEEIKTSVDDIEASLVIITDAFRIILSDFKSRIYKKISQSK